MNTCTYIVCKFESRMAESHVLQEAVQLLTVQGAPGTNEVLFQLCLLQRVVVIKEVKDGWFCGTRS